MIPEIDNEILNSNHYYYHPLQPQCMIYEIEKKSRKYLYRDFYRNYIILLRDFKREIKLMKKMQQINELIVYKKDKCAVCTDDKEKFIKSPCCKNSYGCYECMIKYRHCLICNKLIKPLS